MRRGGKGNFKIEKRKKETYKDRNKNVSISCWIDADQYGYIGIY